MLAKRPTVIFELAKIPLSRRCKRGIVNGAAPHFQNVYWRYAPAKSNGALTPLFNDVKGSPKGL